MSADAKLITITLYRPKNDLKYKIKTKALSVFSHEDFLKVFEKKLASLKTEIEESSKFFIVQYKTSTLRFEVKRGFEKYYTTPNNFEGFVEQVVHKFRKFLSKKKIYRLAFQQNPIKKKIKEKYHLLSIELENEDKLYKLPSNYDTIVYLHFATIKDAYYYRSNPSVYSNILKKIFFENLIFAPREINEEKILYNLSKTLNHKFYLSGERINERVFYFNYHFSLNIFLDEVF